MNRNKSQTGFGHMALIVFLVVAAGIAVIGYVLYGNPQNTQDTQDEVSQTVNRPKTADVPAAPVIKSSADLDNTQKVLDQVDPVADGQADSAELDSQTKDL